jgi:cancer susceptibility candidate protein 1
VLTVTPESNPLSEPLSFLVDERGCRLLSPSFPALQSLLDTSRAPALLLRLLSEAGVHVVPEERDGDFVGLEFKEVGTPTNGVACSDFLGADRE